MNFAEILDDLLEEGHSLQDIQQTLIRPDPEIITKQNILKLRNYILYATAKDLSIFVTFRRELRPGAKTFPRIMINNQSYCFSIKIIDLDPKHVHRISKYVSQKEEWLSSCTHYSDQ